MTDFKTYAVDPELVARSLETLGKLYRAPPPPARTSATPVNHVFPGRKPDLARDISEMQDDYHQIHHLHMKHIQALTQRVCELERRLRELEIDGNGEKG